MSEIEGSGQFPAGDGEEGSRAPHRVIGTPPPSPRLLGPTAAPQEHTAGEVALASDDVWAVGYNGTSIVFHTLVEHWDGAVINPPATGGRQ
jgi:hypothetical protein